MSYFLTVQRILKKAEEIRRYRFNPVDFVIEKGYEDDNYDKRIQKSGSCGFEILTRYLGLVEAERFITLVQREKFDYTQWRQTYCRTERGMK